MMRELFTGNTPNRFWRCMLEFDQDHWDLAIRRAIPILGIEDLDLPLGQILGDILGEGRFGEGHWELGAAMRFYYNFKPLLPRALVLAIRQIFSRFSTNNVNKDWLIEDRYVRFLWEVMLQLIEITNIPSVPIIHFWPDGKRFALVLTHDIESRKGMEFALELAEIEQELGFRSSFNFVPEKYSIDKELIKELIRRGFEIGVHGLKHDGRLFSSSKTFSQRAIRINRYLDQFGAKGFRTPLTHRNPKWMQALQIDYDLSFFDSDPFEPIPGGTMSIWPFQIGHFIELPYTLVQDHTLVNVLGERSPDLWLQKVDFIEEYYGLVLVNSHPDYMRKGSVLNVYVDFLKAMKEKNGYWHALPKEVAHWWSTRSSALDVNFQGALQAEVRIDRDRIVIEPGVIESA